MTLIFLLLYFFLSFTLVAGFHRYALAKGLIDIPNARSSHRIPTPRGGGIVFAGLWLGAALLNWLQGELSSEAVFLLLPGAFLVAAVGYGDDRYHLSPLWRVFVHLIAALITAYCLYVFGATDEDWGLLDWYWPMLLGVVFAVIWSVNLFNFMDGIDGLAGMEACFVFTVGGWWLWQAGATEYAYLAWILVATVAGFLIWNWPPAKIFMGDGGSGFLGFLVATFALIGQLWWDIPVLLWLIVYGVFWFDATVTLLRRILAGERWYSAHRSHAYQRLHQAGWSHSKVLLAVSGINMVLLGAALWANGNRGAIPWVFFLVLLLLVGAYGSVERLRPMYPK